MNNEGERKHVHVSIRFPLTYEIPVTSFHTRIEFRIRYILQNWIESKEIIVFFPNTDNNMEDGELFTFRPSLAVC